jgi:hypothetical protein
MILTGKTKELRENLSQVTNPTWTNPGVNLGPHGERPATNRLSHGMTFRYILNFLCTRAVSVHQMLLDCLPQ